MLSNFPQCMQLVSSIAQFLKFLPSLGDHVKMQIRFSISECVLRFCIPKRAPCTMRALKAQVRDWLGSLKFSQYNELCNHCSKQPCKLNCLSHFALEFTRSYHIMQLHQLLPFILLSILRSYSQPKEMWNIVHLHIRKNIWSTSSAPGIMPGYRMQS